MTCNPISTSSPPALASIVAMTMARTFANSSCTCGALVLNIAKVSFPKLQRAEDRTFRFKCPILLFLQILFPTSLLMEALIRGRASSIHGIGFEHPGHGKTLAVRSIDFSRFLMSLPINANIICKLDIEGSEFAVLRHLIRTGSMKRIRELYCEFHERFMPNESEQSKNELIRDVEKNGTKVHTWY